MKEFKIRASSCGKLMGKKGIGKTGESYLNRWMIEQIFERRQEFSNKYTQKGDLAENGSIEFIKESLGLDGIKKYEGKEFMSEFMRGTPDVIMNDVIIDVKNSWDCFTFPFFAKEVPNMDYYWQAQVYMDLVGIDKYLLIYILSDTPQYLIERESFYWCKENGYEDKEGDMLRRFENRMTYSDIEDKDRIRVFEIDKNQEDIDLIKERVEVARNYINKNNK